MPPFFSKNFGFGWGALPPRPSGYSLGGQSPPRHPPPKRSSAAFDRGGQTGLPRSTAFFSVPLTTPAPPGRRRPSSRTSSRTFGRPDARPNEHRRYDYSKTPLNAIITTTPKNKQMVRKQSKSVPQRFQTVRKVPKTTSNNPKAN